jgi:hypothetical protein
MLTLDGTCRAKSNVSVSTISSFEAVNHPQIAYWFFSKDMLNPERNEAKIDSLSTFSKFTLIFITSRNGVNFYDAASHF